MYTKGNKTYSEPYGYLRHRRYGMVCWHTDGDPADYTDQAFQLPLSVTVSGKSVTVGGLFTVTPRRLDYPAIKAAVVKLRYSNDDQMAIILNRDSSPEDALLYTKMQEWRDFAAEVARRATSSIN